MNPILRNILAVVAGWAAGSIVNMGLILTGHKVFPIPGVDMTDEKAMDIMAEVLPTLGNEYFIFPFLAHALGTLVGGFVVAKLAANNHMKFALGIGGFFLLGGIYMPVKIPSPIWFIGADLLLAYIPMAMIGGKMALKK